MLPSAGTLKTMPYDRISSASVKDVRGDNNNKIPVVDIQNASAKKVLAYFPPDNNVNTSFTFKVIDANGKESAEYTATLVFTGNTENRVPDFNTSSPAKQTFTVGEAVNRTFAWSNFGNGKLKYTLSPALPAGLSYDGDGSDDTGVELGKSNAPRFMGTPVRVTEENEYTLTVADSDTMTGTAGRGQGDVQNRSSGLTATLTKPTSFAAALGDNANEVDLSWDAISIASNWQVRFKQGEGDYSNWTPIADSDAATTSHTVTGLTEGATYTFQVRAVNGGGDGPESDGEERDLGRPAGVPGQPQDQGRRKRQLHRGAVHRAERHSDGGRDQRRQRRDGGFGFVQPDVHHRELCHAANGDLEHGCGTGRRQRDHQAKRQWWWVCWPQRIGDGETGRRAQLWHGDDCGPDLHPG